LVFRAERRASPVRRWYQPPTCAVVVATVPPVRPAPFAVICGWSDCCLARRKKMLTLAVPTPFGLPPPLVWISSAWMFDSASRAVSIWAAVAFHGIGSVVWPSNVRVNVPAVAPVTRTVCCSSVFCELNGP
jgi:hypothetical protein